MSELGRMFLVVIVMVVVIGAGAASRAAAGDDEQTSIAEELPRDTPSGEYIDPASFFRFHGYVTLTYAEPGSELGSELAATPQILIGGLSPETGENAGGFKNDAALFVGGEPFEGVGAVVEIHFVGTGLDPVITEAKVTWDVIERSEAGRGLRLIMGRYWWPFGIHNAEWFSAINRFSLISPAAAEAVPAHFNEVGIMVEGELPFGPSMGLNYVLSAGNGVPSFELMDNVMRSAFDFNDDRTLTGRLGWVVGFGGGNFELGVSASRGELRSGLVDAFPVTDARHYPADFAAFGGDFQVKWDPFELRSYYHGSSEDLDLAPVGELERAGLTVEPSYRIEVGAGYLHSVLLVGRYSFASEDTLSDGKLGREQLGVGVNLQITKAFVVKLGYLAQQEKDAAPEVDNDVFALSLTGSF